MSVPRVPVPHVVDDRDLTDPVATAVLGGTIAAVAEVTAVEVTGSGVIPCLQGLLTNDVEAVGADGFLYGAVLTAKGMIVCDMWTARLDRHAWLAVPRQGTDALFAMFDRCLPPRLARAIPREEIDLVRVAGPTALRVAGDAGIAIPAPATCVNAVVGDAACIVARPPDGADFALQIQLERERTPALLSALESAGAEVGAAAALDLSRILVGWPRLGAEIDDKTLPQEVRFEEHQGVSYTKGCYTGQETVARVHFRGHANRQLVGLVWEDPPDPDVPHVYQDDRPAGRVTSVAWVPPLEQHLGLGILRREVDIEQTVLAGTALAGVIRLPFHLHP